MQLRNFLSFDQGFKSKEVARNFTNCGTKSIFWYYHETQTFLLKMKYADFVETTFNSTLFLQNTTTLAFTCTDAAENLYYFTQVKAEQFPTWTDLFLGFLQNLLGNAIRLKNIEE